LISHQCAASIARADFDFKTNGPALVPDQITS
jgi:hypothetical protein